MESEHQNLTRSPEIKEQKRRLRQECRQIRTELGEAHKQRLSQSICDWIETWQVFQLSTVILTYMPITGEVDLTSLIDRHPDKRWVLPRIIPEEHHSMVFHPYECGRLVHHPFGMDEPDPDLPIIDCNEIQLALVPGLAFDRSGKRLGYGGGYFDRFLCDFNGISLGVVFKALLLDELPYCERDIPVNWIVTENGFIHPGQSS